MAANQVSLRQGSIMYFTIMTAQTVDLVVCLENSGYEAALERRKLYGLLPDAEAETRGLLRVINESGEDYLHPAGMFYKVELPLAVRQAVFRAA